jgi:hypothetical protein
MEDSFARCVLCNAPTCQCALCAKAKGQSGFCNPCYIKSTVEKSQPQGGQNSGEAKK